MTGILKRINARRPELLKQARVSENFRANLFVQFVEFRQKLIADFNNPWHDVLCTIRHYAVNCICNAKAVDRVRRNFRLARHSLITNSFDPQLIEVFL